GLLMMFKNLSICFGSNQWSVSAHDNSRSGFAFQYIFSLQNSMCRSKLFFLQCEFAIISDCSFYLLGAMTYNGYYFIQFFMFQRTYDVLDLRAAYNGV